MRKMVNRARELSRTVVVGLRRAVDPPLDEHATPLDISHAILEAIESRVPPSRQGRRVLPDGAVRVKVLVRDAADERALRAALLGVGDAAKARMREVRCELAPGFRVDVSYLRARPAAWGPAQRIAIDYVPIRAAASEPVPAPPMRITVLAGTATKASYTLQEAVVRVGRSEAPVDGRGRVRRNDVVFLENDDEQNRTVTRGHAEIRWDGERSEFRVFDEGSANGTRILRGGEIIDVPPRDPVGVGLRTGDGLQFGKAAVRVTFSR